MITSEYITNISLGSQYLIPSNVNAWDFTRIMISCIFCRYWKLLGYLVVADLMRYCHFVICPPCHIVTWVMLIFLSFGLLSHLSLCLSFCRLVNHKSIDKCRGLEQPFGYWIFTQGPWQSDNILGYTIFCATKILEIVIASVWLLGCSTKTCFSEKK